MKRFCRLILYLALLAGQNGWGFGAALSRFEFSQPHMGTEFRIVCYAADARSAMQASDAAFSRIAELNSIMSDYSPTSELSLLSRKAGGPPTRISEDLFRVLAEAQALACRTNGAFDTTIGPLTVLWRRARRRVELPSPERLKHAMELVGYGNLRLDPVSRSAQLLKAGMLLDLGGIAKGYAADEAIELLKKLGIQSALVAAGGDIAVSAAPPNNRGWTVRIASLRSEQERGRHLLLHDAAVSTSGDTEQYVVIGGRRYSHIVDPKTGMGLLGRRSVTVVAPRGTFSDGLATAVSVLGPDKGLELIESTPDTAALILEEADGGVRVFQSKSWKEP